MKGTSLEGNKTASTLLGIANRGSNQGNDTSSGIADFFSTMGHDLGIGLFGWTRGVGDINKDSWRDLKTNWLDNLSVDEAQKFTLAWSLLLMSANRKNDIEEIASFTTKDIKNLMKEKGWSKESLDELVSSYNQLGSFSPWPNKTKDDKQTYIDWSKLGLDGYNKAGLALVPKDNYHALLHKNEMVLNERDANIYRKTFGKRGIGGSLNPNDSDYVGDHHSGYAGHNGIDLYFGEIGTPVGSAVSGKVIESKDIPVNWNDGRSYHGKDTNGIAYSSYGKVVKVLGDDGHTYIYAHLNERKANTGDIVSAGTLLGYSGSTGNSSGPHLHFEVSGAGTGEAAHAKYYTPYVRNVSGISSTNTSSSSSSSNISAVSTLGSRRYVSKALTRRNRRR